MEELLSRIGNSNAAGLNDLTKINRIGRDLTFSDILKNRLEQESGVKFSAHAMNRLNERGIVLKSEELTQLSDAISLAEKKGANDTLVIINDKTFIVSVKNKTIVTAMTGENIKNNVFTNIDSTVIV
ncbi:TIGR02530 family flagellar biosynthesis protein [Candidatus Latescibacterota bacterium]